MYDCLKLIYHYSCPSHYQFLYPNNKWIVFILCKRLHQTPCRIACNIHLAIMSTFIEGHQFVLIIRDPVSIFPEIHRARFHPDRCQPGPCYFIQIPASAQQILNRQSFTHQHLEQHLPQTRGFHCLELGMPAVICLFEQFRLVRAFQSVTQDIEQQQIIIRRYRPGC